MKSTDPQKYISGVLAQDRPLLARTITLIESARHDHQELSRAILDGLLPHTGKAVRLGITGVPGAGKSTFIESLGTYLTGKGHRVAVLAVDPSSTRSGGSVLADKTRMERLSVELNAFIRPSPSSGTLGGVARKTRETMLACEAAGFDVIIVETVGVGQSEIAVASMVDFFLVLMLAGAGDEIQGIKKGILELADAVTVNKADGDNIKKAQKACRDYKNALHFLRPSTPNWSPPVLTCSALEMNNIDKIWETVLDHRLKLSASGELDEKRSSQSLDWMWSLVEEGLKERFRKHPQVKKNLTKVTRDVSMGKTTPTIAACELLELMQNS
ncbi:MAG: methylmalonyl Co-A mutase-associated GTPase MeaB [Deltaproteobacteria bacterium]|nr:methylmalonyl Co-A mutase-associated GTPase MeaB [Deltaproteobacteria bacterium]